MHYAVPAEPVAVAAVASSTTKALLVSFRSKKWMAKKGKVS